MLLIVPTQGNTDPELLEPFEDYSAAVERLTTEGALVQDSEYSVPSKQLIFRMYRRVGGASATGAMHSRLRSSRSEGYWAVPVPRRYSGSLRYSVLNRDVRDDCFAG